MSEYFSGVTFPFQSVTPSDDAIVRRAALPDGSLAGFSVGYSGYTLTVDAGYAIACGRLFRHAAAQNWAVTGAASGYARLILTIDITRTSTKDAFDQITDSIQYASSLDGFLPLTQEDINQAGRIYQIVVCTVSLGVGGITGIVSQMAAAKIDAPTKAELAYAISMINYVSQVAHAALPQAGGTLTGPLILTEGVHYGTYLPAAGNKGRFFFKKV